MIAEDQMRLNMQLMYSFNCPLLHTAWEGRNHSFGKHKSLTNYLNAWLYVAVARVGLEARYNPLVMLIY